MTKIEFLEVLKSHISEYPEEETKKSLEYYEEMIEDRIEDGMSEAEAVASLGKVEDIAEQIKCELPLKTIVKQKAKEKTGGKIPGWAIVLIVIGVPVWFPIICSILGAVFSFIVGAWGIVFALWIADIAVAICSVAALVGFIVMMFSGSALTSLIYLGIALAAAGITVFGFAGCFYASKGLVAGIVWLFKQLKKSLVGKKEA